MIVWQTWIYDAVLMTKGGIMTCSNCGFEYSEGFYCPGCGSRVTQQAVRPATPPIPPPPVGKTLPQVKWVEPSSTVSPLQPAPQEHARRNVDQPKSDAKPGQKNNGLRVALGIGFLLLAIFFGMNAFSGPDSSVDSPSDDTFVVDEGDQPQDFSIKESCEEVRADFMNAAPGSDEERWALEAAEEVCFGQ